MFTIEQIQKKRTPSELNAFIQSTLEKLKISEERKNFRLRKGYWKEFIEELYPLSIFTSSVYDDDSFQVELVLGNQGYDAQIFKDGIVINKVEIGWRIDGRANYKECIELNKKGFGSPVLVDKADKNRLLNQIVSLGQKKSLIDYSDVDLVIVIDNHSHFICQKNSEREAITHLRERLIKIKFRAKSV